MCSDPLSKVGVPYRVTRKIWGVMRWVTGWKDWKSFCINFVVFCELLDDSTYFGHKQLFKIVISEIFIWKKCLSYYKTIRIIDAGCCICSIRDWLTFRGILTVTLFGCLDVLDPNSHLPLPLFSPAAFKENKTEIFEIQNIPWNHVRSFRWKGEAVNNRLTE